jgi:hypothetical protein
LRDSIWHLQGFYAQLFFFYLITRYAGDIVNEVHFSPNIFITKYIAGTKLIADLQRIGHNIQVAVAGLASGFATPNASFARNKSATCSSDSWHLHTGQGFFLEGEIFCIFSFLYPQKTNN